MKKKKKYMLSFFSAAVQFYVVTFSLARCVYTVNIRKSSNTKVTLHNAGSVHSNTSDVKDCELILILLCKHLIWYIGIYTNTHYAYMTTVICAHKQILSSLEALPIVRLGGVSRQKSQYFQLI